MKSWAVLLPAPVSERRHYLSHSSQSRVFKSGQNFTDLLRLCAKATVTGETTDFNKVRQNDIEKLQTASRDLTYDR
ncbi:hypothetical protein BTN45_23475 [Rhizobium sp. ZX09]|nr:hypothetical protein BTN45_23475 [Rhizobium sp. ZX09]